MRVDVFAEASTDAGLSNELTRLAGIHRRPVRRSSSTSPSTALGRARERVLVAGGRYKFPAVLAALTAVPSMRPTMLVTDDTTATRLLEVLSEPRYAAPVIRSGP